MCIRDRAKVEEADLEHTKAKDELAELKTKMAQAIQMEAGVYEAAPPGFIRIEEAERLAASHMAEMHRQLGQAVFSACNKDGEASEVAQSDIGDAFDVDDVEGWSKMEKGKRKATLDRSGRMVANKVKASIAKVPKAASASFSFAKARAAEAAKGAGEG